MSSVKRGNGFLVCLSLVRCVIVMLDTLSLSIYRVYSVTTYCRYAPSCGRGCKLVLESLRPTPSRSSFLAESTSDRWVTELFVVSNFFRAVIFFHIVSRQSLCDCREFRVRFFRGCENGATFVWSCAPVLATDTHSHTRTRKRTHRQTVFSPVLSVCSAENRSTSSVSVSPTLVESYILNHNDTEVWIWELITSVAKGRSACFCPLFF